MKFTSEEVIGALYLAVFNREVDIIGLNNYVNKLDHDSKHLPKIAHSLHVSDEHKSMFNISRGISDHSQFGELREIISLFMSCGVTNKIVVDVGARGRDRSNSFDLLSQFGWKGVLVEANPALYSQIRSEFDGCNFVLEECAVGPNEGTLPFFIGVNDDVSSLIKDAAVSWGRLKGEIMVDVRRLPDVLYKHHVPSNFDLLSLDIEGMDVSVFNDLIDNSSYRPRIVIIEASNDFSTKHLEDVGASKNVQEIYEIVGQTRANLILRTLLN